MDAFENMNKQAGISVEYQQHRLFDSTSYIIQNLHIEAMN